MTQSTDEQSCNNRKGFLEKVKSWFKSSSEVGEEIQNLIESRDETEEPLSDEEKELIASALKFSAIDADDACVARSEVVYVQSEDSFERIRDTFAKSGHSRLPVVGEDLDDIRGFVTIKDIFNFIGREGVFRLKDVLRQCTYVPSSLSVSSVLTQMRQNRVQMAIVVDEYGGTSGLITLKDILAELVGDIEDENEVVEAVAVVQLTGGRYQLDPRLAVDDMDESVRKEIGVSLSEEYETLGGYVLHRLGRVPEKGEKVKLPQGGKFLITDSDGRRINQMIFVPEKNKEEQENKIHVA